MDTAALFVVPPLRRSLRSEMVPDPVRDRLADVVAGSALAMLDPARIEAMAEDMRVIQLKRTHHVGLLVCSVILSAIERKTDTSGRWLDAQTVYEELGGPETGKTSFRNQTRKMLPVMGRMLQEHVAQIARESKEHELRGRLREFSNLLVPDGCAFKLASVLSGMYPGTGTPSEIKLHAVYNLKMGIATITQTAGCVHDNDEFWPEWEANALYLWDLGYNDMKRFVDAKQAGSHVVQRLKSRANPIVVAWYDAQGTRHSVLDEDEEGLCKHLEDVCQFVVPGTGPLDMDVELRDRLGRTVRARVVCVPFEGEDRYYLTTLPRDIFTPFDVAELYRLRWEVELVFRNWKGAVRLDDVHRLRHPISLQVAITASLLAAVLGRDIHAGLDRLSADLALMDGAPSSGTVAIPRAQSDCAISPSAVRSAFGRTAALRLGADCATPVHTASDS